MKANEKFVLYQSGENYVAIKNWDEDDRPREKLMKRGANALTDAELIGVLLGHGMKGISAVDVARNMLHKFGDLNRLSACDYSEFAHIKGIGEVKAVTLAAVFELGKRIDPVPFQKSEAIKSPEDVARRYINKLSGLDRETFRVLLLNSANIIFREHVVSTGVLNSSVVHPREVFKLAIADSAASIILMHNHPSGNPEPSPEDVKITKQLVESGEILDIKVLDHIIIAGSGYSSLKQLGKM